jgi:SAM-dependent methyltransferase
MAFLLIPSFVLRFITKKDYWELEESGILAPLSKDQHPSLLQRLLSRLGIVTSPSIPQLPWHLKTVQDAIAYAAVKDLSGATIAEIGGGHSRILPVLADNNACVNVEPFAGVGNGPTTRIVIPGVISVDAMIGTFSPDLAPTSFDAIYSVSVVEHVPTVKLDDFFRDCARILKPSGLMVHLIDMYLGDQPGIMGNKMRLRKYLACLAGPHFEGADPTREISANDLVYSAAYATNPDNIMGNWNRISPELRTRREIAQCCALLLIARRTASAS